MKMDSGKISEELAAGIYTMGLLVPVACINCYANRHVILIALNLHGVFENADADFTFVEIQCGTSLWSKWHSSRNPHGRNEHSD